MIKSKINKIIHFIKYAIFLVLFSTLLIKANNQAQQVLTAIGTVICFHFVFIKIIEFFKNK